MIAKRPMSRGGGASATIKTANLHMAHIKAVTNSLFAPRVFHEYDAFVFGQISCPLRFRSCCILTCAVRCSEGLAETTGERGWDIVKN
jgi:hypothetical protein